MAEKFRFRLPAELVGSVGMVQNLGVKFGQLPRECQEKAHVNERKPDPGFAPNFVANLLTDHVRGRGAQSHPTIIYFLGERSVFVLFEYLYNLLNGWKTILECGLSREGRGRIRVCGVGRWERGQDGVEF